MIDGIPKVAPLLTRLYGRSLPHLHGLCAAFIDGVAGAAGTVLSCALWISGNHEVQVFEDP